MVLDLPANEAGAPAGIDDLQKETINSLDITTNTDHKGKIPFLASQSKGASRSNLSARGSS